jgi:hypothetical protein
MARSNQRSYHCEQAVRVRKRQLATALSAIASE